MPDSDDGLDFSVDLVAEGDDNAFHMANLPGENFRRVLAQTTSEKSPLNMRIKIVEVHHGKMIHEDEECAATLLIFEFRFQSRVDGRRYQSVTVTLDFFDKAGTSRHDPVVVDLAPDRMHWLNKTTYDRRTKLSTSAGVSGGSTGVASADAKVAWEMEQTKPLKFKATLTGNPARSKGKVGDENAVTWTMKENGDAEDGVPSFLQTAVLLKRPYGGAFEARLHVRSDVDMVSAGLRALPVRSDKDKLIDPVAFTPGRKQVHNNKVSGITEADLESMETIDLSKLFKVNLSEEDDLTPGAPGAVAAAAAAAATGATEEAGATGEAAKGEATKEGTAPAGEGVPHPATVKVTKVGWSIGKGTEGADDDDDDDDNDAGADADAGDDDAGAPATFGASIAYTIEESAPEVDCATPSAAPAQTPAPALERKLPSAALATPSTPAPPTAPTTTAASGQHATAPSSLSSTSALVSDTVASAVEAARLAAQAAATAAEAAKKAAEAATAASRAAEAALNLIIQLGLK